MQHKTTLITIILFLISFSLHAQSKQISLTAKNAPIKTVLAEIQTKSGYRILYNDEVVPDDLHVSVNAENTSVKDVLNTILKNTDLTYIMNNEELIIITLKKYLHTITNIRGKVLNKIGEPLEFANIVLQTAEDSTFINGVITNRNGEFTITNNSNIETEKHVIKISSIGYETVYVPVNTSDVGTIVMNEITLMLDEVIVTAELSDLVKRTATGHIFYLSEQARNSGDPYRALREIPLLIVNEALRSVTMEDGSRPLVLVDGRIINSGITPIDPQDIESVEVIDVVSARYLRMGVKNILNIRLKKKRGTYKFFEAATRHDIPLRNSMGVTYFEVGNAKHSLYGRFSGNITHNDDSESEMWQKGTDYLKESIGKLRDNDKSGLGELLYKWSITNKDYLAAHIYGKGNGKKTETWGNGSLQANGLQNFDYSSINKNDAYILTTSLYYQHEFSKDKILETTLAYNKNSDNNNGERNETFLDDINQYLYEFKSDRSSASLNIDYSWTWNDVNSLNIGSATNFVNDRVDKVSENVPVFRHKAWNEYLYASFGSKAGNLLYMASAGLDGIWMKAGEASNRYIKPRLSVSGTYQFSKNNSTRMSYTLTNQSPSIGQLNPYNTSTDPLVITKGNPELLPEQTHSLKVSHTFNKKRFYVTPSASYNISTDIIEPFGYNDNGVFVNTYKNVGSFKTLAIGSSIRYRFKEGRGNIYVGGYHHTDYFADMPSKQSFSLNGGIWIYYKKWMFGGDINYRNYEYTPISRIKQLTPAYSQFQVNYNFTKDFYVAVALPYFIGKLSTETETQAGTYSSYHLRRMTSMSGRPWILLRYTIRKNEKSKIKLDNVVRSKEEGISL
jgi:hypothetical protein